MPAILTSQMSSLAASSFIDMVSAESVNLYIAVGGTTPWTDETVPDTPTDTLTDENNFRKNIIGIKKVSVENAMLMVPRVDWEIGMEFNTLSNSTIGPRKALDYYCLTGNNFVYQCVGKSSSATTTQAGCEPDLMIADQTTVDGYTWKFLYNITTQMVNEGMLLDSWMPVPYGKQGVYPGGTLTEQQHSYGDVYANWTLGAFRVLLTVELKNEGDAIPYDVTFRKIGLIESPRDRSGNLLAGDTYKASEFDTNSGHLVYRENRCPITRATGQTELLQTLLCF